MSITDIKKIMAFNRMWGIPTDDLFEGTIYGEIYYKNWQWDIEDREQGDFDIIENYYNKHPAIIYFELFLFDDCFCYIMDYGHILDDPQFSICLVEFDLEEYQ